MTLSLDVRASFGAAQTDRFTVAASLAVDPGETLVVLGPSGSGKTLLLETVAGFHPHDGTVALDDRDLTDLSPEDRGFGFVFQDYALFPHMTVRENVAFGQRYRGADRDPDAILTELGVGDLAERSPPTLSGGEAQRVALARALAVDPSVMLLDEPLSSLDVPTRQTLRQDLLDVLADATAVYVTHDRTTARTLGDRIAVMRGGEIVQVGSPDAIFERPASPFVAEFTGSNVLTVEHGSPLARVIDATGRIAVRPEHVRLDEPDGVPATVERVTREDAAYRVLLSVEGTRFEAFTRSPSAVNESVRVSIPPERVSGI